MGLQRLFVRTVGLREAASTIFALVTLLPFLVLLYFLYRLDALSEPEAQAGLFLALLLAVLGFVMLQQVMARVSGLARAVAEGGEPTAKAEIARARVSGLGDVAEISQIGTAFARMLDDLRMSTERLEDLVFKLGALSEMVELAARVPNIQELMALVLERTMRTVRATTGSIMLVDHDRQKLRVVAARGNREGAGGAEYALGEGVPGVVAQFGETVVVDDVSRDPRFAGDARYAGGSFLCLPVRVEDRIIGVVNLARQNGSATPHGFTPTDLQFLQTLMSHIAYSVDNARLLEETRQAAARLEQALTELQTAQTRLVEGETLRAMGQMASGMAHHLNNLLAVVSGRIQLLLMQIRESQVRRPLEIAKQATEDAAEVVRRVLEFTARQPVVGPSSADVNQLVREVLELTRPRWHDQAQLAGVAIEAALQLENVAPVAGEVSGLREVLMNLVLNAIDAMPKGGRLTIRTWMTGGHVYCAVADTGVGMSEDVRHRIFEPFFTTKGPQGVGLGLSVSHAIIERHRGAMTVESESGVGTTVTFNLPAASREETVRPVLTNPRMIVVPLRILLVDDEAEVRAALADSLSAHGHTVIEASNGREALDRLEAGQAADLILTDLGMPEMTGWELARIVKERSPDMPVGLITGWGLRPLGTEEQRRAVDFVVAKPFTIDGLLGAITEASAAR
ncbi:MAG: GAF domain-containing protein [Candidatus Rokubacteria bacterium]|nr:GAF domain-containing protein [Candidatus Rokubacteria bacterium]